MLINEYLVKELYETTDKTIKQIAEDTRNTKWKVWEYISKNYDEETRHARKVKCYSLSKLGDKNPMTGKLKENHHNYIGDVSDGKGYLMRVKPDWYTGRIGCKHVFVHHLVVCEALGITEIPKGFHVHHIDGDKTNNNINNLSLLTAGAHSRLHQLERATTSRKA